jgi:Prokaryotic homologs of the JAB domain
VRPDPGAAPRDPAGPPSVYEDRGRRLLLPAALQGALTRAFASPARERVEAGALLYGIRGSEYDAADTVRALVVPQQEGYRARYHVPHAAIANASAVTRDHGWVTLGQVHTHPGGDVEHSWYDDRHAVSVRAVSLVLPFYGRDPGDWPDRIGVHDYQDGWWHLLTAGQAAERISLGDLPLQIIDLRGETYA